MMFSPKWNFIIQNHLSFYIIDFRVDEMQIFVVVWCDMTLMMLSLFMDVSYIAECFFFFYFFSYTGNSYLCRNASKRKKHTIYSIEECESISISVADLSSSIGAIEHISPNQSILMNMNVFPNIHTCAARVCVNLCRVHFRFLGWVDQTAFAV